jgi:hypothetical protein
MFSERMSIGKSFHSAVEAYFTSDEIDPSKLLMDSSTKQLFINESVRNYYRSLLPILVNIDKRHDCYLERATVHHALCYQGRIDAILTYK